MEYCDQRCDGLKGRKRETAVRALNVTIPIIDGRARRISKRNAEMALNQILEYYPRNEIPDITIYSRQGAVRYLNGKIVK